MVSEETSYSIKFPLFEGLKTMYLGTHLDDDSDLSDDSSSPRLSQPPIKKGLSKYYHGRSRSFTSMSEVTCVEDLAKKERPVRRGMKSCKSFGGELDVSQECLPPGPCSSSSSSSSSRAIPNKGSRGSCSSASRLPPIPMQKNF